MKSTFSDNKFSLERQGVVVNRLSEYISRDCRLKLVKVCIDSFNDNHIQSKEENRRSHLNLENIKVPTAILAEKLGVSQRTVQRWISGKIDERGIRKDQGCNANAEKLIRICLEEDWHNTIDYLFQDLENHRFLIESIAYGRRQGDVVLEKEVIA